MIMRSVKVSLRRRNTKRIIPVALTRCHTRGSGVKVISTGTTSNTITVGWQGLPRNRSTGRYRDVVEQKQRALDERYRQNPERFVRGRPRASLPPATVAINPVESSNDGTMRCDRVNFPTLTAAGYVK